MERTKKALSVDGDILHEMPAIDSLGRTTAFENRFGRELGGDNGLGLEKGDGEEGDSR